MIDEKKLIKDLIPILNENGDMFLAGKIIGTIDRQPHVGGWIPVSERLPDKEANEYIKSNMHGIGYLYPCLLTYRSPNTERIHVVRFYYDIYEKLFVNNGEELCEKDRCIAWQPLPEPYKAGERG